MKDELPCAGRDAMCLHQFKKLNSFEKTADKF